MFSGRFSIAFCLFFLPFAVKAQHQNLTIKGCVVTDSGTGLSNCYVKISTSRQSRIVAYFNTGDSNCFTRSVPFIISDTLFVAITHVGFSPLVLPVYTTNTNKDIFIEMVIHPLAQSLSGVTLKTPAIWKRGDTTNYQVDAFREGDERKLKDIITKMPGFEIDKEGKLLYKKKQVGKILIDGEEIFSEKTQLLLQNFPIHAINTIQALENQESNKILKGLLSQKSVYVNLKIDKKKIQAGFGDFDAGLGSSNRYLLSPVLFVLKGKLKAGTINNWNNISDGLTAESSQQLRPGNVRTSEKWMVSTELLHLINDIDSRRYVRNEQMSNNVQINYPIGSTIKGQSELNFFRDKQNQSTFYSSSFYTADSIFKRQDTNNIFNKPKEVLARQNLIWAIDTSTDLKAVFSFYSNHSSAIKGTIFLLNGIHDSSVYRLGNRWKDFSFQVEMTHRISPVRALTVNVDASVGWFVQKERAISKVMFEAFPLPDKNYTLLNQNLSDKFKSVNTDIKVIRKKNGLVQQHGIVVLLSEAKATNKIYFTDNNGWYPVFHPDNLNNAGIYSFRDLRGYAERSYKLLKQPLTTRVELGISNIYSRESGIARNSTSLPLYKIELRQNLNQRKKISHEYSVSMSQDRPAEHNFPGIMLPEASYTYRRNANMQHPAQAVSGRYGIAGAWNDNFGSFYAGVRYERRFSGFMRTNDFSNFVQLSVDTFIKRPVDNFFMMTSIGWPSIFFNALFDMGGGYSRSGYYIRFQTDIHRTKQSFLYAYLSAKRNWNRKYYLQFMAHFSISDTRFPGNAGNEISSNVSSLRLSLKNRIMITNYMSILANTEWFLTRSPGREGNIFCFSDLEYSLKIPKKKYSFSVKAINIGRRNSFYSAESTPNYQTFFSIPLVKWNVLVRCQYEI